MKNWKIWILLGCVAFLLTAFLWLDFRIATSNTNADKNITTTSIGEGLPCAMRRREKINLVLIGEAPLLAALQNALMFEINNSGIGESALARGIERRYPSPVLVVKLGSPTLLWTPFFATSQFTIQAGYSSVGNTTFIDEPPIIIDNLDGPALNMYGEYEVSHSSWGLMSRRGYYQILADYLAQQIVAALKDLYGVST